MSKSSFGRINVKAAFAEFIAMSLFVYIGCGAAMFFSAPINFEYGPLRLPPSTIAGSFGIVTALAFGLSITFLVFAIGHISGGHINSAVTWGLFITRRINIGQLIVNHIAQFSGSILGAAMLMGTLPSPESTSLGSNMISPGATPWNAFLGETVMTFVLMFTILFTTCVEAKDTVGRMAPIAIGFAVFAGHSVLIPLDGCSINPSRSFGPALLSGSWNDFWVFVAGPYLGSTLAGIVYTAMQYDYHWGNETTPVKENEDIQMKVKNSHSSPSMTASPSEETLVGSASETPDVLIY